VRSEEGAIKESRVLEGSMESIVKDVALEALKEWDPSSSDFTVIKAKYELRYKLPLNPNLAKLITSLGLEYSREGREVVVQLPVYTISFDNAWLEDSYIDRKMYIVSLVLDDESKRQIEDYAVEATRGPKKIEAFTSTEISLGEEEIEALEEGLKELEEEKPKRKRSRRRKG